MGAEVLLREVEEKRNKTLLAMEAEYETKKEEVHKRTEEQKSFILESAKGEAASLSQREKARIDGAAKLQSKKALFDATEKMLENNTTALRELMEGIASSKEYPALLSKLVKYASTRLGKDIGVICRASDADVLKKAGVKVISSRLNSAGGFKAESKDKSLELDLTFEELLRSHQEDTRAQILGKA